MFRVVAAAVFAFLAAPTASFAAELKIALENEVSSLDPHFHNFLPNVAMSENLYNALTALDDEQRVAPALAESWTNASPTEWVFRLRPNTLFSNGKAVTAEDVAYSLNRPKTILNSPSSFSVFVGLVKDVKVIDDRTVSITTVEPAPLLPIDLRRVMIVPKASSENATTEDFNSGKAQIGTGPYVLDSWVRGDRIELKPNPHFWGEAPKWEKVTLRFMKAPSARLSALLSRDVDVIEGVLPADATKLRKDPKVTVTSAPRAFLYFFQPYVGPKLQPYIKAADGGAMTVNPLANRDVRRAMAMALNKQAIIDRLLEGEATPNGQILLKGAPAFSPKLPASVYDPEGAKALLAKAGYPNGFQLVMHCGNDRVLYGDKMCLAYAQMLTRIGIKADVETMPHAVWVQKVNKRDFSLAMRYWDFFSGEPSEMFKVNYHTPDPAKNLGLQNRGEYSNPAMDAEIEVALSTMDDKAREEKFRKLTEELVADAGMIPFLNPNQIWASSPRFKVKPREDGYTLAESISPGE